MAAQACLAVDWGTTHVRAWRVAEDGRPAACRTFDLGVSRLQSGDVGARLLDTVRPALDADGLPTILAGMAGSDIGWKAVPYVDCPADAAGLAAQVAVMVDQALWTAIVPGLRGAGVAGPDVMRGEETQVFGWLAGDTWRRTGAQVICLPGTHAKWVLAVDGAIVRFVTAMTGELFDILTRFSVVGGQEGDADGPAFDDGVDAAGRGDALSARLFSARSRRVGGADLAPQDVRAYLSGLLIGADVVATPPLLGAPAGTPLTLVGDAKLCARYARALARRGVAAAVHDGEAAALAGLRLIYAMARGETTTC